MKLSGLRQWLFIFSQICGLIGWFFVSHGISWWGVGVSLHSWLSWGLVFLHVASLLGCTYINHGRWTPRWGLQKNKPHSAECLPVFWPHWVMRPHHLSVCERASTGMNPWGVFHGDVPMRWQATSVQETRKLLAERFIFLMKPKGLEYLGS